MKGHFFTVWDWNKVECCHVSHQWKLYSLSDLIFCYFACIYNFFGLVWGLNPGCHRLDKHFTAELHLHPLLFISFWDRVSWSCPCQSWAYTKIHRPWPWYSCLSPTGGLQPRANTPSLFTNVCDSTANIDFSVTNTF